MKRLTADIGSHVDTFLELVADDDDDESAVEVVDIGGPWKFRTSDPVVIGLVCLHQCQFRDPVLLRPKPDHKPRMESQILCLLCFIFIDVFYWHPEVSPSPTFLSAHLVLLVYGTGLCQITDTF